jgi:hypothetical protein
MFGPRVSTPRVFVINSNATGVKVSTLILAQTPTAVAAPYYTGTVYVAAGVRLNSTTIGTPSLEFDANLPPGSWWTLINDGEIRGAGQRGADGTGSPAAKGWGGGGGGGAGDPPGAGGIYYNDDPVTWGITEGDPGTELLGGAGGTSRLTGTADDTPKNADDNEFPAVRAARQVAIFNRSEIWAGGGGGGGGVRLWSGGDGGDVGADGDDNENATATGGAAGYALLRANGIGYFFHQGGSSPELEGRIGEEA